MPQKLPGAGTGLDREPPSDPNPCPVAQGSFPTDPSRLWRGKEPPKARFRLQHCREGVRTRELRSAPPPLVLDLKSRRGGGRQREENSHPPRPRAADVPGPLARDAQAKCAVNASAGAFNMRDRLWCCWFTGFLALLSLSLSQRRHPRDMKF